MSAESASRPNILNLPDNIERLLDEGLRDANLPGGNTAKFNIEGHPDLLVRLNQGYDVLEIKLALHAANQAVRYGVHVLPSQVVSRGDNHYVVTQKVQGEPLLDVLASHPGTELLAAVDEHWQNLGHYIMGQMKQRKSVAEDIFAAAQCMVGTTATDKTSRLRMVDLPTYSDSFKYTPDAYNTSLCDWVEDVVEVEAITGQLLHAARSVTERAFALSIEETKFGSRAVHHMRALLDQT